MGLDNPIHIAFLLVILLLIFGAKRLPEMGRSLGAGLRGFKETISGDGPPVGHVEQAAANAAASVPSVPGDEPTVEPSAIRSVV